MRDAAHHRRRPQGLPVVGDFDCKIDDAKLLEEPARAHPPCGELLHTLLHGAFQAQRFLRQQRRRIAGIAQFGDERARREEFAQPNGQYRGIRFDDARRSIEVTGILTECDGSLSLTLSRRRLALLECRA